MLERGIWRWETSCPPEVWQRVAREIESREVCLARLPETGEPVGALGFEWTGTPLWREKADAGYIHTMAIEPVHMGRQLGRRMLECAIDHIRSRGKRIARLDCMTADRRLRACYESAGFHHRGGSLSGAYQLSRYQLPL